VSLGVIGLLLGLVSLAWATRSYYNLWKWAREMQHVRLAIQHKNRVKYDATLVEFMLQARLLDKKGEERNGQVFYRADKTTVAILKQKHQVFNFRQFMREVTEGLLLRPFNKVKSKTPRIGRYKTQDDTPKENKAPVRNITPEEVRSRISPVGRSVSGPDGTDPAGQTDPDQSA
jgi:hypothetical protein